MRGAFFMWLGVGLVLLILGYFVIVVLKAFYEVAMDLRSRRELNQLAEEYANKRDQRQRESRARLDTGCAHVFDDDGGALPPDVCRICGMARVKPPGPCDHRWEKIPGIVPQSKCTLCGETFSTVHGV